MSEDLRWNPRRVTRDEFEQWLADGAGITVATLHNVGHAMPCPCDNDNCLGWQMDWT